MHPDPTKLWKAPRWAFAVLLASLGMLGPFSIDTFLPAFSGIARSLDATPLQMQQTLSAYLFAFAFMNLFHGSISDSVGRRPVVLCGIAVFTVASIGCALSTSIGALVAFRALQGLSTGAGIVVSRAVIRDMFRPADAQRMMSQVTIWFGIAPAVAPVIGGWLFVAAGWHSIFWFLALVGAALWIANWRLLPETLHRAARQPFAVGHLMRGYRDMVTSPPFMLLVLASGVPFNGMFLYVLSSPTFLGDILGLAPTQFFWFFVATIGGIMAGAWLSGRLAGRMRRRRQIRWGFVIMGVVSIANLLANLLVTPHVAWALVPLALFAFGWSLMVPVVTLLVLDLFPERRGMASSLQAAFGSLANGVVAGAVAPAVLHSAPALAAASLAMRGLGRVAWTVLKIKWPHATVGTVA